MENKEAKEWMYNSDTYKEILEKAKPHIGTLVLDMFEVVLLVGVEADEDDFYYVYQPAKGSGWARKDGKEYWASCVGTYYPLKGVLPEREYNYLVWLWNNNYNIGTAC